MWEFKATFAAEDLAFVQPMVNGMKVCKSLDCEIKCDFQISTEEEIILETKGAPAIPLRMVFPMAHISESF